MTNDYLTEQQARERELARILWQITVDGNAERAERLRAEYDPEGINAEIRQRLRDQHAIDQLRSKLTSWPANVYKRYEIARALTLGWWHQHTGKEKRDAADNVVLGCMALLTVVFFGWLALR